MEHNLSPHHGAKSPSPCSGRVHILELHDELLILIIHSLIEDLITDNRTGYQYIPYSRGHRVGQEETKATLRTLCRTCRKLNAVATPILYGHATLKSFTYPKSLWLKSDNRPWGSGRVMPPEPPRARGVATLGLFLRTLVECPSLRSHVRHLDSQFFLLDAAEGLRDRHGSLDTPQGIARAQWELEPVREASKGAKAAHELAIFEHVGLAGSTLPGEVHERALAAILLLATELRSVTLAPTPGRDYCPLPWRDHPDYMSEIRFRSGYNGRYYTLDSLLEQASNNQHLSMTALPNLEAVRFRYLVDHGLMLGGPVPARKALDNTTPTNSRYTFRIDACPALLKRPTLVEFRADSAQELQPSDHPEQDLIFSPNLRQLFIALSGNSEPVLRGISRGYSLETLVIRETDNEWDEDEPDADSSHMLGIAAWNTVLTTLTSSLKVLDIESDRPNWDPPQHLSCLPGLFSLEHLRIDLPLLNASQGFTTRLLEMMLPHRLKTLTIKAGFSSIESLDEESGSEESDGHGRGQRPIRPLLSGALWQFSRVCSQTHPHLRSVMVFGSRRGGWVKAPPGASANLHNVEKVGPTEGRIVADGRGIKESFAQSGVKFRELFDLQEAGYPFMVVHVARYA